MSETSSSEDDSEGNTRSWMQQTPPESSDSNYEEEEEFGEEEDLNYRSWAKNEERREWFEEMERFERESEVPLLHDEGLLGPNLGRRRIVRLQVVSKKRDPNEGDFAGASQQHMRGTNDGGSQVEEAQRSVG